MNEHTFPISEIFRKESKSVYCYRLFRSVVCREGFFLELYSVTVSERDDKGEQSCLLCDVAESKSKALSIMQTLAEITVSPCHAEEIFSEISLLYE